MAHNYEAVGKALLSGFYTNITIPQGYEASAWRPPLVGETFLATVGGQYPLVVNRSDAGAYDERLILRKVEPKVVGWTVRLAGRAPVNGELYVHDNKDVNNILRAYGDGYEYTYPAFEALVVSPIYEGQE